MPLAVTGRGYVISPATERHTRLGGTYQSVIVNCGDSIKPDTWYLSAFGPTGCIPELDEGDLIEFSGTVSKWTAKDAKGQNLKNAFQLAVNVTEVNIIAPDEPF